MNTTTIQIGAATCEVDYNYTPPQRGSRDRYGAPIDPDCDEDWDIIAIRCEGDCSDLIGVDFQVIVAKVREAVLEEVGA